jgi:hypothetical protein
MFERRSTMRCHAWIGAALLAVAFGWAGGFARAGDGDGKKEAQPAKSVEDLVRDLASDDFKTREDATEELGKRGATAIPALEKAAQGKDPEVRWRAEKALKAARTKAGEAPQPAPQATPQPQPQPEDQRPGGTAPPLRDPTDEGMRELERGMRGYAREFLKEFKKNDLPDDFRQIFDEMEKSLRDLDRPGQQGQQGMRDFWTFKFKDGKWQIEHGGEDSPMERIGLRTEPLSPVARAQLVILEDAIAVEEVKPGSIAARAGVQRYDIVFSVDGRPARSDEDIENLARPGDHEIAIMRAGKRDTLRVTVAPDAPAAPPTAPETTPREGKPESKPGESKPGESKPDEGKVRKY